MPVSSATELYHPPNARFQNGNRVYKVVMLGEGGVGKSALTLQFVMNTFQEDHDPTIEDAYQKQAAIDGHTCILDVLDTAGQDEFTAMREQYMRGGEGFLLVYSVTERSTFMALRQFKSMVDRVRNYDNVPVILVGNKSDLEKRRKVTTREGEALAKEFGCMFYETSAALRHNVDQIYHSIVRCIRRKEQIEHGGGKPQSNQSSKPSIFSCCLSSPTD